MLLQAALRVLQSTVTTELLNEYRKGTAYKLLYEYRKCIAFKLLYKYRKCTAFKLLYEYCRGIVTGCCTSTAEVQSHGAVRVL